MSLMSDAVMLIYCDFDGDPAEHDHWHTYEHLHERLSIPGFLRGTRWARDAGTPRYMIIYEVAAMGVAQSGAYLERLNAPSPWTAAIMPRLRGMTRGFCTVAASTGYGLGGTALSMRFRVSPGMAPQARTELAAHALPALAASPGIASAHLFEPGATPPMTKEQSMRGRDADMGWVLLATAYDLPALSRAVAEILTAPALAAQGVMAEIDMGIYTLQHTVTSAEVARAAPNPPRERTGAP